jgi:hypothetical protein
MKILHALDRFLDRLLIWGSFKSRAPSLDYARTLFFEYAVNEPAWNLHYTEQEIINILEEWN